jgi:hypothetical protein
VLLRMFLCRPQTGEWFKRRMVRVSHYEGIVRTLRKPVTRRVTPSRHVSGATSALSSKPIDSTGGVIAEVLKRFCLPGYAADSCSERTNARGFDRSRALPVAPALADVSPNLDVRRTRPGVPTRPGLAAAPRASTVTRILAVVESKSRFDRAEPPRSCSHDTAAARRLSRASPPWRVASVPRSIFRTGVATAT